MVELPSGTGAAAAALTETIRAHGAEFGRIK